MGISDGTKLCLRRRGIKLASEKGRDTGVEKKEEKGEMREEEDQRGDD